MNRSELRLKPGGLMRCCTTSFFIWADHNPTAPAEPGEEISCAYENKVTMVVNQRGDAVQWIEADKHKKSP